MIVVDAHGDLTKRILSIADVQDEDDLLLLEAWPDAPFRLNLFDCPDPTNPIAVDQTVSGIVQVFKKLFGSPREFYPRLERDLGNAARTVLANGGTLLDVPRLFWDDEFRATALRQVTNPRVREFWQRWERIGRPDRQLEQLESTINRLDQFLSSEFVSPVVDSTTTTIPFDEVLSQDGRVLLVSLPIGEIGEGLCNLLGSLFLAVLTERIFARAKLPPEERTRVHLYLDEYGRYATPTTAQLLTEGRKFGVGTTIAHQTRAQIPDEENKAAELQVGTLLCFQLIGEDAAELSGEFHVAPEPQWEERVEEVEGTEPVLAISQAPLEHLLRSTHADPAVRAIVQQVLVPLQRVTESDQWPQSGDAKTGLTNLDQLLIDVMEGRIKTTPQDLEGQFAQLLIRFREAWKFGDVPSGFAPNPRSPALIVWYDNEETIAYFRAFVSACLQQCADGATGRVPIAPTAQQLLSDIRVTRLVDLLVQKWKRWQVKGYVYGEDISAAPAEMRSRETREILEQREKVASAAVQTAGALCKLLYLCQALAKAPVMVPSGQERPRVRVRYITHPQRSYQDVQNELAVDLASLPRFTVFCNMQGEQHKVTLNPPIEADLDEERIDAIREASKARFGRPPEEAPVPETLAEMDTPASRRLRRHHQDEE